MLSVALEVLKNLNPKAILAGVLFSAIVVLGTWAYWKYDIVSASDLKDKNEYILKLETALDGQQLKLNNALAKVKEEESKVEAAEFEKGILEFELLECEEEDFNETIVDPNADYLPF